MVPWTFNICYDYTRRTYQKQLSVSNPSSRTSDDIASTLIGKAAQRDHETLATYFWDFVGAKVNKNYIANANVERERSVAYLLCTVVDETVDICRTGVEWISEGRHSSYEMLHF